MRRVALFSTLLLLLISVDAARAFDFEGLGARGGTAILVSNFEFDGESRLDSDTKLGLAFGVFTEWEVKRRSAFHLQVGANYVSKGYKGRRNLVSDATALDVDVSVNYLSVPILARVLFSDDDDLRVYAVVGPSFEILLDNDEDVLLDDFASWSLAGNVGVGVEFLISDPLYALLELRFNTDFTDSYDGPDSESISSIKQQMVMVTGGLRF